MHHGSLDRVSTLVSTIWGVIGFKVRTAFCKAERHEKGGTVDHPNVARARQALAAFAAGDIESYKQFFADDVAWHVSGHHPLSGTYRGKEELFEYFARIRELTGGSLRVETDRILADAGHVGIFARVTAQRDGRNLDVKMAQALHVSPEGNWTEYWALSDDQEAVDAFWS